MREIRRETDEMRLKGRREVAHRRNENEIGQQIK
jgi:hypothetical protein